MHHKPTTKKSTDRESTVGHSFIDKAVAHWTKERETKLTGGKHLLVLPSEAPQLLRVLGLMNADASISADKVRKYLQINHMLQLLLPQIKELSSRHKVVRVLDACCGTSFLALLLAWYLRERLQHDCEIIGIDANSQLITTSSERAAALGLNSVLKFHSARLSSTAWQDAYQSLFTKDLAHDPIPRPHLVLALHACDTASDHALALAVQLKADVIAAAPCCHAELAAQWKQLKLPAHPFSPVFQTPNIRRDVAAQMTDTLRILLLRSHGYAVTATEFVESVHTPKNRLILATRRGSYLEQAQLEYTALKTTLADSQITLETLLNEQKNSSSAVNPSEHLARHSFAVIKNFISPMDCAALRQEIDDLEADGHFRPATIGRGNTRLTNQQIRSDQIYWLDPSASLSTTQQNVLEKLNTLKTHLNQALYLGMRDIEAHLAMYETGSFYTKHLDRHHDSDARILSVVLYLNDDWQADDEGSLKLYNPKAEGELLATIAPEGGTLVCFLSGEIPHEVMPPRRRRYSLTAWMRR